MKCFDLNSLFLDIFLEFNRSEKKIKFNSRFYTQTGASKLELSEKLELNLK